MDSLAYSVMLEINANTANLNKDLQKVASVADGYHKQVQKSYNGDINAIKGYINAHTGLNKVYKEELTTLDKIGHAFGEILKYIALLPAKIVSTIGGLAADIASAVSAAISISISSINKHIDGAIKRYYDLVEEFRFANFQGAGGVEALNDKVAELSMSMGALYEDSKNTIKSMAEVGFSIKNLGKDFGLMSETIWGLERITGVSSQTSAKFAKSLMGVGYNAEGASKFLKGFAGMMEAGILTTQELTQIIENIRGEMYLLEFAFGTEAVEQYSQALGDLAGAAKLVGVDVSKVTNLMSELNNNPMKFIVALGNNAFYKSAGENMEILIGNLDKIKSSLDRVPPGLKGKLLQDIYGLDAATLKALEGIDEFRKKYPAIRDWGVALQEANSSLTTMYKMIYSKLFSAFDKLAAGFARIRTAMVVAFMGEPIMKLGKKIGQTEGLLTKLQNLFQAISVLIERVFNIKTVEKWAKPTEGWITRISKKLGEMVDYANKFILAISHPEGIKILHETLGKIATIFNKQILPAIEEWADYGWKKIEEGAGWIWDTMFEFAVWLDAWIAEGGPDKLWKSITNIAKTIKDFATNTIKALIWVGGAIKDYVIDPIIWLAKQFIWVGKTIKNYVIDPLIWIGETIVSVGSFIYNYMIKPFATLLYDYIMTIPRMIIGIGSAWINDVLIPFFSLLGRFIMTVGGFWYDYFLKPLADGFKTVWGWVADATDSLLSMLGTSWDEIGDKISEIGDKIKSAFSGGRSLTNDILFNWTKVLLLAKEFYYRSTAQYSEAARMSAKYHLIQNQESKYGRKAAMMAAGINTYNDKEIDDKVTKPKEKPKTTNAHTFENLMDQLKQGYDNLAKIGKEGNAIAQAQLEETKKNDPNRLRYTDVVDFKASGIGSMYYDEKIKGWAKEKNTAERLIQGNLELQERRAKYKSETFGNEINFNRKAAEEALVKQFAEYQLEEKKNEIAGAKIETKSNEIPSGAVKSGQAEAAATKPINNQNVISNNNEEKFKNFDELIGIGAKQIEILGDINVKIGKNLVSRNNPSNDEVTSTTWG